MKKTLLILSLLLLISCNSENTETNIDNVSTGWSWEVNQLPPDEIVAPNEFSTSISQWDAPSLFE